MVQESRTIPIAFFTDTFVLSRGRNLLPRSSTSFCFNQSNDSDCLSCWNTDSICRKVSSFIGHCLEQMDFPIRKLVPHWVSRQATLLVKCREHQLAYMLRSFVSSDQCQPTTNVFR
ncbi:unnamed protein product [Albugo candida]|uniref:Uncharacterized protein n=1 Tax=Albugo candida TaxID=65357 RepID=A0A024GG34_9STRA|nr:unnamed protein product [Albugo candida]|eukprot:CCI45300.1 unnamed protein product [Albugo candida]